MRRIHIIPKKVSCFCTQCKHVPARNSLFLRLFFFFFFFFFFNFFSSFFFNVFFFFSFSHILYNILVFFSQKPLADELLAHFSEQTDILQGRYLNLLLQSDMKC